MLRDEQSGFDAAIYRNDQGQYVVAFRGTDQWFGPEGADIKANGGQAFGLTTDQYQQAIGWQSALLKLSAKATWFSWGTPWAAAWLRLPCWPQACRA